MTIGSLERALPEGEPLLLDTSILVSHAKGTEIVSPIATHVMDHLVASGRNIGVISVVTVTELLVGPLRGNDDELFQVLSALLTHTPHLSIARLTFNASVLAARLRARFSLATPDALIMATGISSSCAFLVTNDMAWKQKLRDLPFAPHVCCLEDHLPFP